MTEVTLKYDTTFYTILSYGTSRIVTIPAGTPVKLLLTTNTPQGDVLLLETRNGAARTNSIVEIE